MKRAARKRFDPPSLVAARNAPLVPGARSLLEFAHPACGIVGVGFWLGFTFVHYHVGLDRVRAGRAHRQPRRPDLVRRERAGRQARTSPGMRSAAGPHRRARRRRRAHRGPGRPGRPSPARLNELHELNTLKWPVHPAARTDRPGRRQS